MGTRANDIATLIKNGSQIDSDAIGTGAITASKLNIGQIGGRRNLVINGAMQVAQRGTSATGITSFGYHTVDRFRFGAPPATFTMDQNTVTDLPGFTKSCKVTCTTAGTPTASNSNNINTRIEGQNLQHLKKGTSDAESVTLSFWVKSNKTGTYTSEIYDNNNARHIAATYTIDAADTWEYKTITFAGDTTGAITNDSGGSFYVGWWVGAGSDFTDGTFNTSWNNYVAANRISNAQVQLASDVDNYFEITGVQLEVGDTATPFEHRSYGEELALCQRYYQRWEAVAQFDRLGPFYSKSTTIGQVYLELKPQMRVAPTTLYTSTVDDFIPFIDTAIGVNPPTAISLFNRTTKNLAIVEFSRTGYTFTVGQSGMLMANQSTCFLAVESEL